MYIHVQRDLKKKTSLLNYLKKDKHGLQATVNLASFIFVCKKKNQG